MCFSAAMDLSNSTVKTPESETETPTRIQPTRPTSSTNGVLKRHAPMHNHHHHPVVVTYKECLKNFAAALGSHSLDGCGEFMPSPSSDPANPRSLMCAVCGCHRNFHRRETEEFPRPATAPGPEFHSHNRHHPAVLPPPPPAGNSGGSPNNSPSPPPISSSYYPSAPHMLMALSHGSGPPGSDPNPVTAINPNSSPLFNSGGNSSSRKRHRTKFTSDQKGKMVQFAEKVGWKMQKKDEVVINEFCNEIGVDRGVFKVWMHNNKNTVGRKDHHHHQSDNTIAISTPPPIATGNSNGVNFSSIGYQQDQGNGDRKQDVVHLQEMGQAQNHVRTNGSSS